MLYRKNGGDPRALPPVDVDAEGLSWSDLANSAEGRAATGWSEAPAYPEFDPATERPTWSAADEEWILEPVTLESIGPRRIAKVEFFRRFTADERVALMAARRQVAALTAEDLTNPANAGLAQLGLIFETFDMLAEFVELDHEELALALAAFEAAGIIAAGRPAELVE